MSEPSPFAEERASPDWPQAVVRVRAGRWSARLALAGVAVVLGAWMLMVDGVAPGIPNTLVGVGLLVAFVGLVASAVSITTRWRTSVRCDGRNLVVRDPLGARVIPLDDAIALWRWLDARHRPVMWVAHTQTLLVPLSPLLDPVRVEAFCHTVGVPVIDLNDPPTRRSLGVDTPG